MARDANGDGMGRLLRELGVIPPERDGLDALNAEQQEIINAYRAGRMEEVEFQQHLAEDPVIADYVRRVAHPRDDNTR